jgi:hypothetical protein
VVRLRESERIAVASLAAAEELMDHLSSSAIWTINFGCGCGRLDDVDGGKAKILAA